MSVLDHYAHINELEIIENYTQTSQFNSKLKQHTTNLQLDDILK